MDNDKLIEKVFEMLKKNELSYRIDNSLKTYNLTTSEISIIREEATRKYKYYVVETLKKRNKICFYIGLGLIVLVSILFFFYLPTTSIVDNVTLISIFGAVLLSFSIYFSYVFYLYQK